MSRRRLQRPGERPGLTVRSLPFRTAAPAGPWKGRVLVADHSAVLHRFIAALARLERASVQAGFVKDIYAAPTDAEKLLLDVPRSDELFDAVDAAVDLVPEVRQSIVPPLGMTRDQCMMEVMRAIDAVGNGEADALVQIRSVQDSLTLQLKMIGGSKAHLTDEWAREEAERVSRRAAAVTKDPPVGEPQGGRRKRRRYNTDNDPKADARLVQAWEAAKRQGVHTIAEFCRERGIDEVDFRAAQDRHRKR